MIITYPPIMKLKDEVHLYPMYPWSEAISFDAMLDYN